MIDICFGTVKSIKALYAQGVGDQSGQVTLTNHLRGIAMTIDKSTLEEAFSCARENYKVHALITDNDWKMLSDPKSNIKKKTFVASHETLDDLSKVLIYYESQDVDSYNNQ